MSNIPLTYPELCPSKRKMKTCNIYIYPPEAKVIYIEPNDSIEKDDMDIYNIESQQITFSSDEISNRSLDLSYNYFLTPVVMPFNENINDDQNSQNIESMRTVYRQKIIFSCISFGGVMFLVMIIMYMSQL